MIVLDTDVLSELTRQYPDQGAIVAADCDRVGRPIGVADAQIASVCRKLQAALATRKIRDLEQAGLELAFRTSGRSFAPPWAGSVQAWV